ncbi:unnamed protein product [Polarella glacialis]|uniref:Uncharacterized protein n=1 Tax=Polarella glacialis TaxID=89957 RepID=A0A813GPL6_POLGL|nr:unnamed protein product [Polarella glacialis]
MVRDCEQSGSRPLLNHKAALDGVVQPWQIEAVAYSSGIAPACAFRAHSSFTFVFHDASANRTPELWHSAVGRRVGLGFRAACVVVVVDWLHGNATSPDRATDEQMHTVLKRGSSEASAEAGQLRRSWIHEQGQLV